jgi:hypothetical protein
VGAPERGEVQAERWGHLLTEQPAKERDAFREFIESPLNASLFLLSGWRGSWLCVVASEL